ncbi:MAG: hypothetical protein ACRBBR_04585 [Cellvibrionaceae bacterium]
MYNDEAYLNKRTLFYQKYFADVLYSRSISSWADTKDDFLNDIEYTIDISEISHHDCYRIASYQRSLYFKKCYLFLINKTKAKMIHIHLFLQKKRRKWVGFKA